MAGHAIIGTPASLMNPPHKCFAVVSWSIVHGRNDTILDAILVFDDRTVFLPELERRPGIRALRGPLFMIAGGALSTRHPSKWRQPGDVHALPSQPQAQECLAGDTWLLDVWPVNIRVAAPGSQ